MKRIISIIIALSILIGVTPVAVFAGEVQYVDSHINIEYDASAFKLTTDMTGREATEALRDAITSPTSYTIDNSLSWYIYVENYFTSVCYFDEEGTHCHLRDSDDLLQTGVDYYLWFNIEDASGYEWDVYNLPTVTVNGVPADIIQWRWRSSDGDINIFIKAPLDDPGEELTELSAEITLPEADASPVNAGISGDSGKYTVSQVAFYHSFDLLGEEDTFEAGETYRVDVSFQPSAGNTISSAATVIINGTIEAQLWGKIGDGYGTCVFCFYYTVPPAAGPSVMKGDLDKDGEISVGDALIALRIAAKLIGMTPEDLLIGDVDGDNELTVGDSLKILRVAAKLAEPGSLN